jgi:hypothetical protein
MTDPLLQFFSVAHLPSHLQAVSLPFHTLAHTLADVLPHNPERTVALRKLLEAKDCAVRAALYVDPYETPVETALGTVPPKALLEECVRRGLIVMNNR